MHRVRNLFDTHRSLIPTGFCVTCLYILSFVGTGPKEGQ